MLVLVTFPHDADKNTQAAGTVRFLRPSAQEALLGVFFDCLVVKKQATTRFQGDDLVILARLLQSR
jgi:hypothetical protein